MSSLRAILIASVFVAGCGPREPGPHENERGAVFYWRVTGSDVSFGEECTDNEEFKSGIEPPEYEPNSFVVYELSDDGSEAAVLSCETTSASSCSESDTGIVFDVSGSELVYDPVPRVEDVQNSECDLEGDELWTLTDEGESATLLTEITFGRVGDASVCEASEAAVAADSPNGKAFDGCTIAYGVELELYGTDRR